MSFTDRIQASLVFEQGVIERLNKTPGWLAFPFGQGQLPQACRERLIRFEDDARRPSLIRWMPDVIAFRDLSNERSYVSLIDAKKSGPTENYAIEMSAIETAEIYTDYLYTPTFFVFDDWKVLTPREARQRGRPGPEPSPGRGSGTPYLLIAKRFARGFAEVFAQSETMPYHTEINWGSR